MTSVSFTLQAMSFHPGDRWSSVRARDVEPVTVVKIIGPKGHIRPLAKMCIIMDECLLLILLVVQSGATVPVALFSPIEMGAIFLATFVISAVISILLAFVHTFERCCSWVHCMNGCGVLGYFVGS